MTLKELIEKRQALADELTKLGQLENPTSDDETRFNEVDSEITEIDVKIDRLKKVEDRNATQSNLNNASVNDKDGNFRDDAGLKQHRTSEPQRTNVSAGVENMRQHGPLKAFENKRDAVEANLWWRYVHSQGQDVQAAEWLRQNGSEDYISNFRAQTTTGATTGSTTVPTIVSSAFLKVVAETGITKSACSVVPMGMNPKVNVNKRSNGLTIKVPGEGSDGTADDMDMAAVSLVAEERIGLTKVSNMLVGASSLNFMDELIEEHGPSPAERQDNTFVTANNSTDEGGVVGLNSSIHANMVNDGGSGDTTWSDLVLADFEGAMGLLPGKHFRTAAWAMSRAFHANVVIPLLAAAGGNTIGTLEAGGGASLYGYPILFTDYMPTATAVDSKVAYFGSYGNGCYLGEMGDIKLDIDYSVYFASNSIGVRTVYAYDIQCHDLGDGGALAAVATAAT